MDYHVKLTEFLARLNADLNQAQVAKGHLAVVLAYVETGRKFDKVLVKNGTSATVRYFVERKTGVIYGAKSRFAPNTSWMFWDLEHVTSWFWGDFHPVPLGDDPHIRVTKQYGSYVHYLII